MKIGSSLRGWIFGTTSHGTMLTRIKLHLVCPCKNWQQARFHLAGIIREFVPRQWQQFVR